MRDQVDTEKIIFVDLDGTLIKTDILVESTLLLIKKNLLYIFMLPLWLVKGKAYLKREIANRVDINVFTLPYHKDFLQYLHSQFNKQNKLFLATASNEKIAEQIAEYVGIFDGVIGSNGGMNLSGKKKLVEMQKICDGKPFIYAGNAKVDISIWQYAEACIVVNAPNHVEKTIKNHFRVLHIFKGDENKPILWLKAIRIHQWLKNILLFVSLFAAHQVGNLSLVFQVLLGFVSFSLCSSSVYLLNDLLDLPSDRCHPSKRNRPFASGTLPPLHGVIMIPFFLVVAFGLTFFLPIQFFLILAVYYLLTWSYSLFLKKLALIDVMTLACLYVIRVVAGSAATGIPLSFWLLAFSMFMFFSLALVKRVSELNTLKKMDRNDVAGRDYLVSDLEYLHSMGVASGYCSALILAFYINSEKVVSLYRTPEILWLTFPLVMYWVSRIWLKAGRGEVPDDPLLFAFRDLQSLLIGVFFVAVMVAATFMQV